MITAVSPVAPVNWSEFVVKGETYQVRSVLGVNEQYTEVMGLDLLAGSLFTADDVANGSKLAVINRSLAEMLFGSAEEALGASFKPPANNAGQSNEGSERKRHDL